VLWALPTKKKEGEREKKRKVTGMKEAAKGRILENSAFFWKKESLAKKTNFRRGQASLQKPLCRKPARGLLKEKVLKGNQYRAAWP
jgi:hypothetical protein